jgi:CheY-like chemotaxis protein
MLKSSSKLTLAGTYEYGFNLILMDFQMPVMDGVEATRRIRALEKSERVESGANSGGRHITIIGVTANTEGEARAEGMESGMDGFMVKPLKVTHLYDCIAKLQEGSEERGSIKKKCSGT